MIKKSTHLIAVYAIILMAFNAVYFFIPFPKTGAAWVCYGFTMLAILLSCGITYLAFSRGSSFRSKIYGFPIFKVGYTYLIAQFVLAIAVLSIGFGVLVPAWIPLVVSVINLAYVLIGVIAGDVARDVVIQQEEAVAHDIEKMTLFKVDLSGIVDMCKNPELKKSLEKLQEEFKYSDPVTNPQLAEIENGINSEIEQLRTLVITEDSANYQEAAVEKIRKISLMLADRNRKCKAFKG